MRRSRFKKRKHRIVAPWSVDQEPPERVAERVRYVGSCEHKSGPSDAGPPRLRKDASRCESGMDFEPIQDVLREAILRRCTSSAFRGGFPKYVWGWMGGTLFEGRLVNRGNGSYKGYPLDPIEYPRDDDGRLNWAGGNP